MKTQIVVPVDGSEHSLKALDVALDLGLSIFLTLLLYIQSVVTLV